MHNSNNPTNSSVGVPYSSTPLCASVLLSALHPPQQPNTGIRHYYTVFAHLIQSRHDHTNCVSLDSTNYTNMKIIMVIIRICIPSESPVSQLSIFKRSQSGGVYILQVFFEIFALCSREATNEQGILAVGVKYWNKLGSGWPMQNFLHSGPKIPKKENDGSFCIPRTDICFPRLFQCFTTTASTLGQILIYSLF